MKRRATPLFGLALAAMVVVGVGVAVTLAGTPAEQAGSPGEPPADLTSRFVKDGDCVRGVDYNVQPPRQIDVSAVGDNAWLHHESSYVGTLDQAAKAFAASDVRSGTDWRR